MITFVFTYCPLRPLFFWFSRGSAIGCVSTFPGFWLCFLTRLTLVGMSRLLRNETSGTYSVCFNEPKNSTNPVCGFVELEFYTTAWWIEASPSWGGQHMVGLVASRVGADRTDCVCAACRA
jgi:hypothetical protein